jgi:hypothetical protein
MLYVEYKMFWQALIACSPLTRHGPEGKRKNYGGDSQIQRLQGGLTSLNILVGHTDKQTERQQGDHINLLLFFQNKESRLK